MINENKNCCVSAQVQQPMTSMDRILMELDEKLHIIDNLSYRIDIKIDNLEYLKVVTKGCEPCDEKSANSIVGMFNEKLRQLDLIIDRLQDTFNRIDQIIP